VYIMDSTGIKKPKMRTGDMVAVTGIVSHYDDHYRILPRRQTDLETGAVLAVEKLPRTGMGFGLVNIIAVILAFLTLEFFWAVERKYNCKAGKSRL
jgi:hypothetical protein